MMISHDTCQATVDKMFTEHEGMLEHVQHTQEVMEERGHKALFDLLAQVVVSNLTLDEEAPDDEQIETIRERTFALSVGLLAYSTTFAAHEANELNEQYA